MLGRSLCAGSLIVALAAAAQGAVVFSDGFESYTAAGNPLDKNTAGPNAAPNGSGNPWFGPAPPNARVVGVDSGVSPHSGNNMIRGAFVTGADIDQNWYNVAYRHNGGAGYTANIKLDWWFYDPTGQNAGSTNFRDYAALGYYGAAPTNTDYPGTGSLNGTAPTQRLSLGALSTGNQTVYQARIVGDNAGLGNGWFNCGVARSVGWHHGTIEVGPSLGGNTSLVTFSIDGVMALSRNAVAPSGYNIVEFNTKFGSQTGYFDDVTFSTVPEPMSVLLLGVSALLMRRRRVA